MTILLLIRHAHVCDVAPDARLRGWYDVPLNDVGVRELARVLEGPFDLATPDALYTSTSTRARVTANALAAAWGLRVVPDERLREIHCGRLDGALIRDIERLYPELWARNIVQDDDDFTWPGGESYSAFRERVVDTLSSMARRHPYQRIAVVTHAGVISQVVGIDQ